VAAEAGTAQVRLQELAEHLVIHFLQAADVRLQKQQVAGQQAVQKMSQWIGTPGTEQQAPVLHER
jgi:hypothetical protein